MWKRIFNDENPFWSSMTRVFDMFILNCLLLLTCIPVFTIGPALAAFTYGEISLIRGEEGYISKDFFRSFRQNFRQGLLIGIPMTLAGLFLGFDVWLCRKSGTGIYTFFMVFFAIIFLVWLIVGLYIFNLLGKFENSTKNTLILAFTAALSHPLQTIAMLFGLLITCWLIHLIPGLIFIAPGIYGAFQAELFAIVFKKDLPAPFSEDMTDHEE